MDKAPETLQQRFSAPSNDELQTLMPCGICWTDYEGEDRPVKLICGHVFGEECILAWARGTTPSGRYNGCPTCRIELLPPSFSSRIDGLRYWIVAIWQELVFAGRDVRVVGLLAWCIINIAVKMLPESQVRTYLRVVMVILLHIHWVGIMVRSLGWRWMVFLYLGGALVVQKWLTR